MRTFLGPYIRDPFFEYGERSRSMSDRAEPWGRQEGEPWDEEVVELFREAAEDRERCRKAVRDYVQAGLRALDQAREEVA